MVAPTLGDYEFQFKDTGVLLNGTSAVPFWDVTKVTGLMDFPELDVKVQDIDGRHGSFIAARFFAHRPVVFDGTLYASSADVDTPIEAMRTSMLPEAVDYPLYFKVPSKAQRYVNVKATSFKCDVDTARRYGAAPFQAQYIAGDPRHYIDGTPAAWTTNVNFNLTNSGNVTNGPLVTITANATTSANITVTNNTVSEGVNVVFAVTNGDVLLIDLDNLVVKRNGVHVPVQLNITATTWPTTTPGATESWKVVSNVGNGTCSNKSTWL